MNKQTYDLPAGKGAMVVPDGWRLVPVEPTPEMTEAGMSVDVAMYETHYCETQAIYAAMLAAAPAQPAAQDQGEVQRLREKLAETKEQSETRWAGYVRESNRRREIEAVAEKLDRERRALLAERDALALLERSLAVIQHDIDEIGGCDHSVGICCCELIHLADDIRAMLDAAPKPPAAPKDEQSDEEIDAIIGKHFKLPGNACRAHVAIAEVLRAQPTASVKPPYEIDALFDALSNLEHDNYERSYSGSKNREADAGLIRAALERYATLVAAQAQEAAPCYPATAGTQGEVVIDHWPEQDAEVEAQIAELEEENADLEAQIADLEAENARLRAKCERLQVELDGSNNRIMQ